MSWELAFEETNLRTQCELTGVPQARPDAHIEPAKRGLEFSGFLRRRLRAIKRVGRGFSFDMGECDGWQIHASL